VERARRGDHDAFSALALGLGDRLFLAAKLILRDADRAADAVQDCLIRTWHELPKLRDPDRFEAWVHRLLISACYNEARRHRHLAPGRVIPELSALDHSEGVIARQRLESGFRRLPVDQRAVLVLHHYVGLTLPEVADAVNAPIGTVKSRLHYATRSMRAALEAEERGSVGSDRWSA